MIGCTLVKPDSSKVPGGFVSRSVAALGPGTICFIFNSLSRFVGFPGAVILIILKYISKFRTRFLLRFWLRSSIKVSHVVCFLLLGGFVCQRKFIAPTLLYTGHRPSQGRRRHKTGVCIARTLFSSNIFIASHPLGPLPQKGQGGNNRKRVVFWLRLQGRAGPAHAKVHTYGS